MNAVGPLGRSASDLRTALAVTAGPVAPAAKAYSWHLAPPRHARLEECPAAFTAAFPHDSRPFQQRTITTAEGGRRYDDLPFWISHASLPGMPAVAAPIGATPPGCPWAPGSSARSTRTTRRSRSPPCSAA